MSSDFKSVDLLALYRMMHLIRRVEERLMEEYHPADEMRCPMHFCVGQESVPAVLSLFVRPDDVMMSHYRSHGYYLGKGGSLVEMIAEFYGKATGSNGGLAGSMELGSHERHFYSGAIVGGTMVIPLGSAFAQKFRRSTDISISIMGDGSFDEGITYESMNLAALWRLPLLILCENNKYAANTELSKRLGRPELLCKAEAMGLEGAAVDGYDLPALIDCLRTAIEAIRSGKGPRFIEVTTYRYCAHVGPQPDNYLEYRTVEEIEHWQANDPLVRLRAKLLAEPGHKERLAKLEDDIEQDIADAFSQAKSAPFPKLDWAFANTWAGTYAPQVNEYFRDLKSEFRGGQAETRLEPF